MFEPNKLRCCIIDRLKSFVELIGDVGDVAAKYELQEKEKKTIILFPFHQIQNNFNKIRSNNLQNANVRPFVGDNVFVRGTVITFGSPIKYDGK